MIIKFNNYNFDKTINVGDFVKIKDDSEFYDGKIYKIDKYDNISFYLEDIFDDYKLIEMTKYHIRKITHTELLELNIILDTKKFNI